MQQNKSAILLEGRGLAAIGVINTAGVTSVQPDNRRNQFAACCQLAFDTYIYIFLNFFLVGKKNTETKNWEMENWKIPFMVVTFVAFLQTYEAESSALAEERRPPEHWQVECLFFELVKNDVQKYRCTYKSFCDLMTRLF